MAGSSLRQSAVLCLWLLLGACLLHQADPAFGQADDASELAAEEAKQAAIAKRFATILEKSPRRGTAFDRVYGFHVENGSLETYVSELKDKLKAQPDDGAAWMILGMIEAHRGQDADAVDAFTKAEEKRPTDALASYYLGQSYLLIGQTDQAVQALERAIERKPERADLLEIFQQLGRVHQRAQRDTEALQVWSRLEALFPNDPRVLEQIASAQVDEGKFAEALPRYERLVGLVKDDYRKTTYRMEVAGLKIRSNKRDAGISDLETLLADLNPDGWLHREVRRRIEDVFLKSGDQDGLVKYYQGWLSKHEQDIDGMARLAKFLAASARVPEATEWLEKALKLAPKRAELRRAFIAQLMDDQRYSEAVQQYALLSKSLPGDSDVLRDWGKAVLKDKSVETAARNAEATRIWRTILTARPDDALTTAQVADLFRQANLTEEATALYEKAVVLAPNDPQYREYLGEYYHVQKKPEKALETWKEIAAGDRKNAVNLSRLAEVLNTFSYTNESTGYIAEAAKLDPKDLSLQLKAADYHARANQFEPALSYVDASAKLAANDEEREAVLKQRIETLQSARKLEEETQKLAASLENNASATAEEWQTLARYYEAERQWTSAGEAIATALEKSPQSPPVLTTAARIAEQSGDFKKAADMSRQLAEADRRSRGEHLMNVARLESQLGRSEEALKAGKDLILSAPGNTEHYEFYAQLCFRLGRMDEGLGTLRKAVRINPGEPRLITALAAALADQFKADEAIQVYWQAFEKSETIDDKTGLILKLAELHLQLNQFDRLIERLERDRREEAQRRMATICIAQAHQAASDFGAARVELESLLSEDTRDTELLQQLSKLCEQGHDRQAAINYQRQIVSIAPAHETEYRLATLLQGNGDIEAATEIYVRLTRREEDPVRLLRSLDALIAANSLEAAIAVTEPLLRENRDNWELLYREGLAWAMLDKKPEATERFDRIISLSLPYDTMGARAADQLKQAQARAKSANITGTRTVMPTRPSPLQAAQNSYQIRSAVGLSSEEYYSPSMSSGTRVWTPDNFASARMAAMGWKLRYAQSAGGDEEQKVTSAVEEAANRQGAPREALYDLLYLKSLLGKPKEIYAVSKRLAQDGGIEEQAYFLQNLGQRSYDPNVVRTSRDAKPNVPPLEADELALLMKSFEAVKKRDRQNGPGPYGLQMSGYSLGGTYVMIASSASQTSQVLRELRNANRSEEADRLLDEFVSSASDYKDVLAAISLCSVEKLDDRIPALFERWQKEAEAELARDPKLAIPNPRQPYSLTSPMAQSSQILLQWCGLLAEQKKHDDLLKVYDTLTRLGIQEAKIRRTSKKVSRSNTRNTGSSIYWYGTQRSSSRVQYPQPNDHIDSSMLSVLRQMYEVFRRNDVMSDLVAHVKKQSNDASVDDRLYRGLLYGYLLWWQEDHQEEAVKVITQAADLVPDDPAFRLELASLHEVRGEFDSALTLVDSVTPRDQKLLQTREMMALNLAERLGEIDRARSAAERLFGLRLSSEEQLALATTMRRLGLAEMADAITSRVERRSGNSPSAMLTLMMQYQGQGRAELAEQLAHGILQRTARPSAQTAAMIASGRMSSSSGDAGARQQALKLLSQTGSLKKLIERTESQLELAPKSTPLYEQLIEYHTAANNRDRVLQLLKAAIEQRPESYELRMLMASQLEATNKLPEACDEYLKILKERPDLASRNFYRVQNLFDRAKRTPDLARLMLSMDLRRMRDPYYITNIATNMLAREETREEGIALFEKCFNELPSYRQYLIGNLHDPAMLKNPKVLDLCSKCLIPTDQQVAAQPWFGLDQINSYSGNGVANGIVDRLLTAAKGTEHAAKLRSLIEERLKTAEGWHGGRACLAILDIAEGKREEGQAALTKLFPEDESDKDVPWATLWLIGLQLDQSDSTRDLAVRLYKKAMERGDDSYGNGFEYSPGMRLVKLHMDRGEKEEARAVLRAGLKPNSRNQSSDPAWQAYQQLQSEISIAQTLQQHFPGDALRIYRDLLSHPERIEAAGAIFGNPTQQIESYKQQARSGMTQSLARLQRANIEDAVAQLLGVESIAEGGQGLDLLLVIPDETQIGAARMNSPLVDLFESIKKNDNARTASAKQLGELRQKFPDDLSVATVNTLWSKRLAPEEFNARIAALLELVRRQPLEELPANGRPNARQRAAAANRIGLWLVARECLATAETREAGVELAKMALEGATRQLERQGRVAILFEWGQVAIDYGDRAEAERRWTELLESATTRPKSDRRPPESPRQRIPVPAAPPAARVRDQSPFRLASMQAPAPASSPAPAAGAPPRLPLTRGAPQSSAIPPLTLSQFRIAIQVARLAGENNMQQLSLRAVKDAFAGGMPVPDAPAAGAASMPGMAGGFAIARPSRVNVNVEAVDPVQQEVAASLSKVLTSWTPEQFPAADVCAVLELLVFPPNRPGEILCYPDSSRQQSGAGDHVGVHLVQWGNRAGRLPQIKEQIAARRTNPASKLPALVLDIELALETKDYPAASAALKELDKATSASTTPAANQLAGPAALRAFDVEELKSDAIPILNRVIRSALPTQSQIDRGEESSVSLGPLSAKLVKYLVEAKRFDDVREFYEGYATARQARWARYSGNYGAYQLWADWGSIANDAAEHGAYDIALDYLGRVADQSFENYPRPSIKTALVCSLLAARSRPAMERYQLWRDWTLPTENRSSLRVVVDVSSPVDVPEKFQRLSTTRSLEQFAVLNENGPLSNVTQLIDAAQEAGQLKELEEKLAALKEKKTPLADTLLALVLIRSDDVERAKPLVAELLKAREGRKTINDTTLRNTTHWCDFLVWREALNSPKLSYLGANDIAYYLESARRTSQYVAYPRIVSEFRRQQRIAAKEEEPIANPFRHWAPAMVRSAPIDGVSPWWTVLEGQIAHMSGSGTDMLFFKYPLSGDFEFSAETSHSKMAQAELGYGGVVVNCQSATSGRLEIVSAGFHETLSRPGAPQRDESLLNRGTIKVAGGKVVQLLNGAEVYSESLAGTSPWLQLCADKSCTAIYRNVRFKGEPTIPREVVLLQGNFMEGWVTSFLRETQPAYRQQNEKPAGSNDEYSYAPARPVPTEYDWETKDGVLKGRSRKGAAEGAAGWAYYHRPLLDGETFRYEFFYEPGKSETHPTFGRLAFLLSPTSIQTRWIVQPGAWEESVLGLPTTNSVEEKELRKGPDALPLKPGDWNSLSLTLKGSELSLELNGTLVMQRPVEADSLSTFGVYHPQSVEAQVRQAVLTGPWPEKLTTELQQDLLALVSPISRTDRQTQSLVLSEETMATTTLDVAQQAAGMSDEEAYQFLRNWVFPTEDHVDLRPYFARLPVNPARPLGHKVAVASGTFVIPAWQLVKLGKKLGKLEELAVDVEKLSKIRSPRKSSRVPALLVLIAVAREDDAAALKQLEELKNVRIKAPSTGSRDWQRAPEIMALSAAADRPALAAAVGEFAAALRETETKKENHSTEWLNIIEVLAAPSRRGRTPESAGGPLRLSQWQVVPVETANSRATGRKPADWTFRAGELATVPGEAQSQLFFQSPLEGKFEVTAEVSIGKSDALLTSYGLVSAIPDRAAREQKTLLSRLLHSSSAVGPVLSLPEADVATIRLVVDDATMTTLVNDTKIHEHSFSRRPSPWLVLQPRTAGSTARVRNLRILGTPQVPESIDLLHDLQSAAWRTNYYGEVATLSPEVARNPNQPGVVAKPAWSRTNDEIIAAVNSTRGVKPVQSVIYYQRPLLEDGEVEFESYYVPGEFEVHPVVGRQAILIEPTGVSGHLVTDAELERSDLDAGNSSLIAGAATSVALKANDWNRIRVALNGNDMIVSVNDVEVARQALTEPSSQRFFGLFRYSDQRSSRVRKVIYRGNWPKTVPTLAEQELSGGEGQKAAATGDREANTSS